MGKGNVYISCNYSHTISFSVKFLLVKLKYSMLGSQSWKNKIVTKRGRLRRWWYLSRLLPITITSFSFFNCPVNCRMFVDVFIECVAWSYWWTWCVFPIICNSNHFNFFVFYFNLSNKISSTPPLLLNFQFSNSRSFPTPFY